MNLILILEKDRKIAKLIDNSLRKTGRKGYFVANRKRLVEVLKEDLLRFNTIMINDDKSINRPELDDYMRTFRRLKYNGKVFFVSDSEDKLGIAKAIGYGGVYIETIPGILAYAKAK